MPARGFMFCFIRSSVETNVLIFRKTRNVNKHNNDHNDMICRYWG